MKKKLLAAVLSLTLIAAPLTGCDKKNSDESSAASSVETTKESATEESETEETETEETTTEEASTEESSEESTEETTEESTEETVADGDMDAYYEEFFNNYKFDFNGKKLVSKSSDENGTEIQMSIGTYDTKVCIEMMFNIKDVEAGISMYVVDDENIYALVEASGEKKWMVAPASDSFSRESVEELGKSVDVSEIIGKDSTNSFSYVGEEKVDGRVCDCVSVSTAETSNVTQAKIFIDKETEEIVKIEAGEEYTNQVVVMTFEDIDDIELPMSAKDAEVVTGEEIAGAFLGVMLVGATGGDDSIDEIGE